MIDDLELALKLPDVNTTYRHCCVLWATLGLHLLTSPHKKTLGMRLSRSLSLRNIWVCRAHFSLRGNNLTPLSELTALAHARIVPPWPSWPGWANQIVYKEKSWPGHSARWVTLLVEPTFVSHVSGSWRFAYEKSRIDQVSEWPSTRDKLLIN